MWETDENGKMDEMHYKTLQMNLQIKRVAYLKKTQKQFEQRLADLQTDKEKLEERIEYSKSHSESEVLIKRDEKRLIEIEQEIELLKERFPLVFKERDLIQSECSHVGLYFGGLNNGSSCRCVLCNKDLTNEEVMTLIENGLVIYASNYRTKIAYDQAKEFLFDRLQYFFADWCRGEKFVSHKVFVDKFQKSYIDGSLKFKAEDEEKATLLESLKEELNSNEIESQPEIEGPVKILQKKN